ncbi:MAG: hypothetical protein ACLPWS_00330 [Rhodomicrobium sp.]
MTLSGDTFALETLHNDEVRPAREHEVAHAREWLKVRKTRLPKARAAFLAS